MKHPVLEMLMSYGDCHIENISNGRYLWYEDSGEWVVAGSRDDQELYRGEDPKRAVDIFRGGK